MPRWARLTLYAVFVAWLFGNIPAWLFMPDYNSWHHPVERQSTAIFYSLAIIWIWVVLFALGIVGMILWGLTEWAFGKPEPELDELAKLKEQYARGEITLEELQAATHVELKYKQ